MPGMTGAVLCERTRAIRPGLPTVLMSGYSDPEHEMEHDVVFLMKPFNRAALAEAVSAAVAAAGSNTR